MTIEATTPMSTHGDSCHRSSQKVQDLQKEIALKLDAYHNSTRTTESENLRQCQEQQQSIISDLLVQHAFHLPGNNWTQDLWQYLTNNHPLAGICLHHPLHPLSWKMRVASLIGSVLFGLAVTNIVYIAFVFASAYSTTSTSSHNPGNDALSYEKEYLTLHTNVTRTGLNQDLDDTLSTISVTNGNIVLWTIGSFIHGLYDNTIWALATCTCCCATANNSKNNNKKMNGSNSLAFFLVSFSVVVVTAIATFVVMLRAAIEAETTTTMIIAATTAAPSSSLSLLLENSPNQVHAQFEKVVTQEQEFQDYEFVVSYLVELILTYVIYYPIAGTILFSGVLSCGRFPITGGRPYELQNRNIKATRDEDQDSDEDVEQDVEVEWNDKSQQRDINNNKRSSRTGITTNNTYVTTRSSMATETESCTFSDEDHCLQ